MKKTILFSSALVALAMLASCQKEEFIETPATATGVTEFTATIESTKTTIASDGKVTWEKDDEITVTDAASKSAVYVAASSGESTTFTLKQDQTAVGAGPYTATYGDITKQVYDANGANCPLEATTADASSKNLQFSSPYAVLKITAQSANTEVIKTVVVTYGNSNSILDCGEGVTLTADGVVFYVAVQPSTEAALSVAFYTADKVAKKNRNEAITLTAKDLLPVTLGSFDWTNRKTFKAVYKETDDSLTFYYDTQNHSGEGITVYENGTDKFLFDDTKSNGAKWGYHENSNRGKIKSVVIDDSVEDYPFLTSTVYMFQGMKAATSISGAEHLNVSNVTNMSQMFCQYGYNSKSLADVPNVSNWNTEKVENMSYMFCQYGYYESTSSTQVPDVSNWNTEKVKNMNYMFASYGYYSTTLTQVPTVDGSNWNTEKVTDMSGMFMSFGHDSKSLAVVPKVENWKTGEVNNMSGMFQFYGYSSTSLNDVPKVGSWNTGKVTNMSNMFNAYANSSTALNTIPDVSTWTTSKVNDMSQVFYYYGNKSTALDTVPDVSGWETGEVKKLTNMFECYGNGAVKVNLDLSGWDLSGLTTSDDSHVFNFNSATFIVKIPAKTGDRDNDAKHWYNSGGTNFIAPPKDKTFTLLPADALAGRFSVSDTKKVHFSKGNLWYGPATEGATPTFNFETNQYDISSSWDPSHVSNFYWSKTASVAYADSYNESGTSASDVFFTDATGFTVNGQTNVWRTLSHDEWKYLFENHTYKYVSVNGKHGIVIAPDGFSGTIADSYTTDWATAEGNGFVFLPSTGYRSGSSISEKEGDRISCIYWTSTASGLDGYNPTAYRTFFQWNKDTPLSKNFETGLREWAVGIRLVTE